MYLKMHARHACEYMCMYASICTYLKSHAMHYCQHTAKVRLVEKFLFHVRNQITVDSCVECVSAVIYLIVGTRDVLHACKHMCENMYVCMY